jgi:chitobiase/beta-hexosaminidase-like protein
MLPADAVVNPAHTILVLKDESAISAEGFIPGETIRVDLKRNGVVVGSSHGPSDNGAYELNHDFCWDDFTPVILPGDVVEFHSSTGVDRVPITDISVTGGPTLTGGGTGIIQGRIAGSRPPTNQLEVFLRSEDPNRFRPIAPGTFDRGPDGNTVTGTIAYDGAGNDFTATFTGMTAEQEAQFANPSEFYVAHAPAGNEMTQATGRAPAPGPGCSLEAPLVDNAVTGISPRVLNLRNPNASLHVQGFSTDADSVTVRLADNDPSTPATPARTATLSAATGVQTWRTTFTPAQLRRLNGTLTVTANPAGGVASGVTKTVLRDLVRPHAPTTSLPSGMYRRAQAVSMFAGADEQIRYTIGNGQHAAPTATRGTVYRGGQLRFNGTRVLKMVAIDQAGNVSPVTRQRYVIGRRPAPPRILHASAGVPGGRASAVARWAAPASTGGARITGYRVTALKLRPNGAVSSRTQSRTLRPQARSLQMRVAPGRYRFRVKALNTFGASALSARSNVVRSR